jgi:HEPN domain-containing protein
MPAERKGPGDSGEWLRRARSNLARAKADRGIPEVVYEDLCFDAQQAAEKSLKGLLVHLSVDFPRTHDLNVLLELLRRNGVPIPEDIFEADALTQFAVETRYPGINEPVAEQEHDRAVKLAEQVVHWVETIIGRPAQP